jgi:mannose-6-phosphate isomerase-like protein (cupin superfamily)
MTISFYELTLWKRDFYSLRARSTNIFRGEYLMKVFWLLGLLAITLLMVSAEEKVPDGFQYWTGASLKELEQTLKTEADANEHHIAVRRLEDFAQDTFMLSRREADGIVEWHENQADVFFVQSGSATLLVGGTMVGGETTEPHEKRNGTIQGGVKRKLSAGDVVRIPPQVPHQILLDGSPEFTYFVVKVKGY